MKKVLAFSLSLFLGSFFIGMAIAAAPGLVVDDPISPVDANKATISGTTDPGARVSVTGGTANIAPVTADSNGDFEIQVGLVQESSNSFDIKAELNGEYSSTMTVTIVEGVEEAQEHESNTGQDRTAPNKPSVDETEVETAESTYTIIGTGEANATLVVSGAAITETSIDSSGNFEVEVGLTGDGTRDSFTLSVLDNAGNISSGLKVYVTGTDEGEETPEPEPETEPELEEELAFSDISNHWGEEYVTRLSDMGAVNGYQDGTFRPDSPITRAEILKISLEAFEHEVSNDSGELPFLDVSSDDWHTDYVAYASSEEIVEGYDDDTFRPNNNVSRAAALKIIIETAGDIPLLAVTPNFPDVDPANDWFAIYTAWAMENDIVSGFEDGTFRAGQDITRAESSKIILEVLDFVNAE